MNRFSIWDILTGITLLGLVCLCLGISAAILSPTPFIGRQVEPTITLAVLNLRTSTSAVAPRVFPATWTPTSTREAASPGQAARTQRAASTLEPTATLYIAPTPTPLPTFTPLPSATRANANCYIIAETPLDNTEFSPNQEFTKTWTLKNNSGKTWPSESADIRYVDGTKFQLGPDAYDLNHDVTQGGSYNVDVRMRAPSTPNTYTANWVLTSDGDNLCRFFIKIVVK